MKTFFRRIPLLPVFLLAGISTLFSQGKLSLVNQQIEHLDSLRDSVGANLNLSPELTLSNYYRGAYFYINEELEQQFDLLTGIEPVSPSPAGSTAGANKEYLENLIATKGRVAAKILEFNEISKAVQIPGHPLNGPLQLVPDWQLRNYHQSLLYTFASNGGYLTVPQSPVRILSEEMLGEVEKELRQRGLFGGQKNQVQILERRFQLVESLNRTAQQEAYHFVDQSPLVVEMRSQLADLTEQIQSIDKSLGVSVDHLPTTRDLIKEKTVLARIEVLEFGLKDMQAKYHITRHYDGVLELYLEKIEEQLSQEKEWLYRQKNHQIVIQGLKTRGPPGDTPPLKFEDIPFSKPPSGGGSPGDLTLDRFLNETKMVALEQNKQQAFEKLILREVKRFLAYGLEAPKWQGFVKPRIKPSLMVPTNDPHKILTHLAERYYAFLTTDPVETAMNKAEYETALKYFTNNVEHPENLNPLAFLENDNERLADLERSLKSGIQAREKRMADLGIYAEPSLEFETNDLKVHLDAVKKARQRLAAKPVLEHSQAGNRPPPVVFQNDIEIFDIQFESYHLDVLEAQKKALQKVSAIYGVNVPASVGMRMAQINSTITVNEICNTLQNYNEYSKDAAYVRYWENLIDKFKTAETNDEFFQRFIEDIGVDAFSETKNQERAIFTSLDNALNLMRNSATKTAIPEILYENARKAHNTVGTGVKVSYVTKDQRWRPNQSLKKMQSMTRLKEPGGIWLSPQDIELPPNTTALDFQWVYVESDASCPENYKEWILDPEEPEKICFPITSSKSSTVQHWVNTLQPW